MCGVVRACLNSGEDVPRCACLLAGEGWLAFDDLNRSFQSIKSCVACLIAMVDVSSCFVGETWTWPSNSVAAAAVTTGQVNILLSSFLHANQDHVVDLNLFFNLDICADLHLGSFGETVCKFTGISPISCGSTSLVGPCLLRNVLRTLRSCTPQRLKLQF